jgi:hypothetical protein
MNDNLSFQDDLSSRIQDIGLKLVEGNSFTFSPLFKYLHVVFQLINLFYLGNVMFILSIHSVYVIMF